MSIESVISGGAKIAGAVANYEGYKELGLALNIISFSVPIVMYVIQWAPVIISAIELAMI